MAAPRALASRTRAGMRAGGMWVSSMPGTTFTSPRLFSSPATLVIRARSSSMFDSSAWSVMASALYPMTRALLASSVGSSSPSLWSVCV